jgi:SAM-dependent methyltransferase
MRIPANPMLRRPATRTAVKQGRLFPHLGIRRRLQRAVLRAAERLHWNRQIVYIPVDYPTSSSNWPRWGHGRDPHPKLTQIIRRHDARYRQSLELIGRYRADLVAIEPDERGPHDAFWNNHWLPGLDAASLYGFLRSGAPARYLEVGSGNSTKFAARAKRDGGLPTSIVSIDPSPRAEVDALCDAVIRQPLEMVDLAVFDGLSGGDIVFVDGSHRTFMNSDATVFFLEVLPRLAPGVLVGIHDIELPDDYRPEFRERFYSEQYLLAAYLLAEGSLIEPVLPCAYVSRHRELSEVLAELWGDVRLKGIETQGETFWLRTAGGAPRESA